MSPLSPVRASTREAMAKSPDARALRTRARLTAAVMRMFEANPDSPPTVAAVCAEAGVTRSAFYSHFPTIDHLVVATLTDPIERLGDDDVLRRRLQDSSGRESAVVVVRDLIEQVRAQQGMFRWVLGAAGGDASRLLTDRIARRTRRTLDHLGAREDVPGGFDLLCAFVAGGIVNVLRTHLIGASGGHDPAELAQRIVALLPAELTEDQDA